VTLNAATTVTATFTTTDPTFVLTVTKAGTGSGSVTSSPAGITCDTGATPDCSESYAQDTEVTLTAAPASGSIFGGWGGACSGTQLTCVVTMNGTKTVSATFTVSAARFTLTVTKSGAGGGTISSTTPGIVCGTDCTEDYVTGTVVTLRAIADTGSVFGGWSGAGCTGIGDCIVTMDAAKSVTAAFTLGQFSLTVVRLSEAGGAGTITSSPAGIACGADCFESYTFQTIVALTAAPAAGSIFTGWTGDCAASGTNPTCTVTVDSNKTALASFRRVSTLTVTVNGPGAVTSNPAGITCGADCDEAFAYNLMVTLTATPASGAYFVGWTGACSGTGTCSVRMDRARAVTATFAAGQELTVVKAGGGGGTVTSNPAGITCGADCVRSFRQGTRVSLTARADATSTFTGWGGACSGIGTCAVTMDSAKSVTATFAPIPQFSLTVTKAGDGTGTVTSSPAGIACGADCSESYSAGKRVSLSARADTNSLFTGWSGACSGTSSTCTVTMDAAKSVTATFVAKQLLTVVKMGTGTGSVTSSPGGISCGSDCTELYAPTVTVTLTARAAYGSTFAGWGGACSGTQATCLVPMSQARNVTATFN
jgi:uncharacterized repeat protein (TIGR02543 family)